MIARFQSFRFDFNAFLYLNLLHYNDECYQLFLGGGFHLTTSLWLFFSVSGGFCVFFIRPV
jgi:hypothetical protein